nr:hypothetical protein CFP56_63044 [Quercus suber]
MIIDRAVHPACPLAPPDRGPHHHQRRGSSFIIKSTHHPHLAIEIEDHIVTEMDTMASSQRRHEVRWTAV